MHGVCKGISEKTVMNSENPKPDVEVDLLSDFYALLPLGMWASSSSYISRPLDKVVFLNSGMGDGCAWSDCRSRLCRWISRF